MVDKKNMIDIESFEKSGISKKMMEEALLSVIEKTKLTPTVTQPQKPEDLQRDSPQLIKMDEIDKMHLEILALKEQNEVLRRQKADIEQLRTREIFHKNIVEKYNINMAGKIMKIDQQAGLITIEQSKNTNTSQ